MRKIGYFFAAFLPFLTAMGIIFVATFFLESMAGLFLVCSGSVQRAPDLIAGLPLDADFNNTLMLIFAVICIVTFGLYYYARCGGDFRPKASETFDALQLAGVIVIVPGVQFACGIIMSILAVLAPAWMEAYETLLETAGLGDDITLAMFCYAVLLAPVSEELIFRGVTLRLARQALPFWFANLFQAVLFGVFHMNWIQGIYAFALGFFLGFVCEQCGSIYYSILLHMLFNFWGTAVSSLLDGLENSTFFNYMLFLVSLASFILGLLLLILGISRRKSRIQQQTADPYSL